MTTLPLDGNPHNTTALLAHCDGASNVVACPHSRFLFTAGGKVHKMYFSGQSVLQFALMTYDPRGSKLVAFLVKLWTSQGGVGNLLHHVTAMNQ